MKRLIKSMCVALVIVSVFSFLPFEQECRSISDRVLRIHILADSDSELDQSLKLKVRDGILSYTDGLYSNVSSKAQAVELTKQNLDGIKAVAEEVLKDNGCNKSVDAQVCEMSFNTRYYGEITMPSGNYTALRVTIGSGNGKNWWCVMYPSLCLYTSGETNTLEEELSEKQYEVITDTPKYKFKFKILEYFDFLCELIG